MMKNIISIYLLVLGIYSITAYTNITTMSYGETENITFEIETTLPTEIDQISSTEILGILNSTYVITDLTFIVTTTEITLSTDETSELIFTEQIIDQTLLLVTNPSTSMSSAITNTSRTTSTTTVNSSTLLSCNASTHIQLSNDICATKPYVQIITVDLLRNTTGNTTIIANALTLYIASITNANISWNPNYILSADEIDEYVGSLNNINLTVNSITSFIMIQQINQLAPITTLGAFYTHGIGGEIINSSNENNIYNSNLTAAAIIHNESLVNVTFLKMFIIDKPTTYENIDNSSNKTLASSVVVVAVGRNSSTYTQMNISLYFQVLDEYPPAVDAIYSCSYYDTTYRRWNDSGCTSPQLNGRFNRYECNCNHLSTFALVWSPTKTSCDTITQVKWINGTCISKADAQKLAFETLNNSTNSTVIAELLSIYISSITNSNTSLNSNYTLPTSEIDRQLSRIDNVNLTISTNDLFLMAQQPDQDDNVTILGASFTRGIGGEIVHNNNKDDVINSPLSTAAVISEESLIGVRSLRMLIIGKPTAFRKIDNSTNKTLASSIIVTSVKRNGSSSNSMDISLYFQVLNEWKPNSTDVDYYCSFYDTNHSQWNESGCTTPLYNRQFDRYECSCDHLSTFALVWSPNITCNTITQVKWINDTCISKADAQKLAFETLNNSTNSTVIAELLSIYISSITNSNTSLNSTYTLPIGEIDRQLSRIDNVNLTISTNDLFLMAQQPEQDDDVIILGASFTRGIGGELVHNNNKDDVINSPLSTAAVISEESLIGVRSLRMLIIGKPSAFRKIDNSTNKTLASSIIVTSVKRNGSSSNSMDISLYFQVLNEWKPNSTDVDYYCSFYDTNHSQWNESGCTKPIYNRQFDRYECSCDHLTSFALLFLPNVPLTIYLNAQDIASLVFQSISIICFLLIIIHAVIIRLQDPLMSLRAYDLLPLISCASTTILFIFFIALGMTVYTKTSSSNQKQCFLSSSVLMFFVYFLLIFMFCVKTSVGYFNYLRFVRLFPQPPFRQLFTMLIISFFISITWVAFAAGFNSNPSFKITQLYPYKLCWFTLDVVYYFLTIPVCIFLLINIIVFILVATRIINHVRNATSPHQSYERMKRCVLVLLSSCLTQGIGWLFGVFLTFLNPTAGQVLGWIFVVFNGLEGLWAIMLYIIIRAQHMDDQKQAVAARKLKELKKIALHKYNKWSSYDNENERNSITKETEMNHRSAQTESSKLFDE